jgi:predicted  nucleic acid-binding Zn-ribbon protein
MTRKEIDDLLDRVILQCLSIGPTELAKPLEKVREGIKTLSDLDETERLQKELAVAKEDRDNLMHEYELESKRKEVAFKDGMIEGLKFAIRCNGVSGNEVRG